MDFRFIFYLKVIDFELDIKSRFSTMDFFRYLSKCGKFYALYSALSISYVSNMKLYSMVDTGTSNLY